ncbi:MAG: GNAT family N-acetyltransferase [Thiohalorhabdus sp.]|uniref:bifunctional acetate--CoA ligase family protein/GNAT family N-acetyltransferase n=1 Tax=Thiohalorhabdus sp. TaxID=3094134 RepID=UPI00397F4438
MRPHYLDKLFAPESVAVFGASEKAGSVGGQVLRNLLAAGFPGSLFAVNPKYDAVLDQPCFERIGHIGQRVDMAVVATPAETVPGIVRECGEHGVEVAVVMSAGFGEAGAKGRRLERDLEEYARYYGIRVLGPNCLGVIRPGRGVNATFSNNTAEPGNLALVSQSGALCTAILDWARPHQVGFSAMVSLGDAADVDFGDVLDYLALDGQTSSILLYVEGIHNARGFMSGLRSAARLKPVIVVKAGRHAAGSRAAMSHTGALVGGDDVFDSALGRAGAVRARTIDQLFAAAQMLAERPKVGGSRLGIVTNAGGPGVLATDRAVDVGVEVPELAEGTVERLNQRLPEHWSGANPLDILGDASPERYGEALSACLSDPHLDGVLAMLTPQAMTRPREAADAVVEAHRASDKPVLACWMGEEQVAPGWQRFREAQVPYFGSPEAAVEAFSYLATHRRNQEQLLQVPGPRSFRSEPDPEGARLIIEGALAEHREVLSEMESKAVLTAFGVPVLPSVEVTSANQALVMAESLGFPVAMKINSPDISHKSDVGGVRLNIGNAQAVRHAYNELLEEVARQRPEARLHGVVLERMYTHPHRRELLVGVLRDPVFGPVVSFGAGGTAVEIMRDRAVALPPLNSFLARRLVEETRISRLLDAYRNLPAADRTALEDTLLGVSELVCELPHIQELDINPLMADPGGVWAVDARMRVKAPTPTLEPYGHMAIHPYPSELGGHFQLADGTEIVIRPIRPEDAEIEQEFVRNLSEQSKYFRFMRTLHELTQEMLVRFTQIDYDREMAFIAVTERGGKEVELGVARYTVNPDGESCEFAIVVADEWRRKGIGTRLAQTLLETAKERGLKVMEGEMLSNNTEMRALAERLHFTVRPTDQDPGILVLRKEL